MENKMNAYQLENGLQVYCYQDLSKHSVFVSLATKYGGLDTDFMLNGERHQYPDGIAHLLEHYLCEQNKFGNIIHHFRDMHMYANASTSMYYTDFYFNAVKDIEKGLEYLISGIHNPIFTEENLEEVKHAVREEILKKQDWIGRRIFEKSMENLFANLRMRNNIGTIEEIDKVRLEMIKNCYEAFYRPENEVLVIAGNFDEEKMLDIVKKLYADLKFSNASSEKCHIEESKEIVHKEGLITMPTGNAIYELGFKVSLEDFSKEQYLDLEIAIYNFLAMNFSSTTKTYQKLKDAGIIKTFIITDCTFIESFCLISIGAYTDRPEEFKDEILNVLSKPVFDKEMFELDKRNRKMYVAMRPDSLKKIVLPFLENILVYDYPYLDKVEDIDTLTFQDMKEMILKMDFSHYTEIKVVDVEKK